MVNIPKIYKNSTKLGMEWINNEIKHTEWQINKANMKLVELKELQRRAITINGGTI
jgi:hypothetical protein